MHRKWVQTVVHMVIVAVITAAASLTYHLAVPANKTTVALTYVLLVLAAATIWGLPEALFASVCSIALFDYYFLPPVPALGIVDPQNWVDFGAFVVTSLVASELSTRSRKRALEATRRQREIERMYALSCGLMLVDSAAALAARVPKLVAEIFGCPGVAFYDRVSGQIHRSGEQDGLSDSQLQTAAGGTEMMRDKAANATAFPVNFGSLAIGSLGFYKTTLSAAAMQSIASLAAMAMDRARKQEVVSRADAARRHQELKSMLLDALAHEFQTPLTSIRTGIGAMLADVPRPEQREWLEIMDEESARLSSMMSETIQMARIEAGHVDLDKQIHTVEDLLFSALEKEISKPSQVTLDLPEGLPAISADSGLIQLVIRQIVGNALRYSPPGAPVRVHARAQADCVVISVSDRGPGIAPEERERIFERYYRGEQGRGHLTGMGMGLPIARQVIEAHDGRIWVESQEGPGATFSFSLPLVHEEANV
jgi:two-component system, OmpR family, sensor histidine kinase KdpD